MFNPDDDNDWKWDRFVEIGDTIHKMRGQVRIQNAKYALRLSNLLIDNDYIVNLIAQLTAQILSV